MASPPTPLDPAHGNASQHRDAEATILTPASERIGTHIGPYRLLQKLGEGGMGAVFMAEQEAPVRRRVALKVIKAGMDSSQVVARFEAERQALALMDHVNIAKVLDAGNTETGQPFFALELVYGVPITQYCDDNRLSTRQRLELFVPVCHAIQHAHQKGIIHRDIKPSNILVTLYDGQPVPKVIDFGVAKAIDQQLTERTMFTQYGAVIGTLEYMSPEQAEMSALGVDTRSDIYSLGVVLYELLTGMSPLGAARKQQTSLPDMLRLIRDNEPLRPSTQITNTQTVTEIAAARHTEPSKLKKTIKGDLDWLVMKCLEKDRTRRYQSANDLARDIERYLADEPVEACPPSAGYRMRRFAHKFRRALAAALVFVLLLIGGVVVSTWQALRARSAEQQAREAGQQMQVERDRARGAMSRQVAERLDGDLRRLGMVGEVLATLVAQRETLPEAELESWMRMLLAGEPSMFALNIGFEPRRFDEQREDYDLYVYRGLDDIETKYLLPPTYLPVYREWDWYKKPKQDRQAQWSEPYVDTGGGEIPMVTYTVPIDRQGEFVGVISLDLSMPYFQVLRGWLQELKLAEKSYGFVISQSGIIISHLDPAYDFAELAAAGRRPRKITDLDAADSSFAALARQMSQKDSGTGTAIDPMTGKWSTFLFDRVPSADWTVVTVIEESAHAPEQ